MTEDIKINVHDNVKVTDKTETLSELSQGALASYEALKGAHSNVTTISYTANEFIFDFLSRINQPGVLISRIFTSPQQAKAIFDVLKNQIAKYEMTYGKIEVKTESTTLPKRRRIIRIKKRTNR